MRIESRDLMAPDTPNSHRRDGSPYGRWRVAVVGLVLACGGGLETPANGAGDGSQAAPPPREAGPRPGAAAPGATECEVMALERCFATAAEACAAIGCPAEQCQVMYSMPMQVTCG
jgi:hypothetical protein